MKNKIILFSIPNYNAVYMSLAIPYLTGYLRKNGFDVIQRDLNVLAYDFFLSKGYLQKCLKKAMIENNREYQQVITNIEDANKAMRDLRIYKNFNEFSRNKKILEKAFEIICKTSKELLKIHGNTFEYRPEEYYEKDRKISYKSREGLLKSIKNKKDSIFYIFFKKQIIPFLKKEKPILIGISIFDQKQLVVAFILSSIIKESQIDAKIVLGGNVITRGYDILSKDDRLNRELFDYVDFIIHHEGEIPITELAKRLSFRSPRFSKIPKLIYKKNGKIIENLEFNVTDLNKIPAPDFDGFDIDLHWTPQPIVSYLTKRGCPHHCDFCDTPFGYDGYYKLIENRTEKKFKTIGKNSTVRSFSVNRVIKEVKNLKKKYKSKYFSFADEELLASFLEIFCKKLIKEKIDIRWECFARMESAFKDKNFCKLLGKTGCMFLQFGLESVSQRVLDFENKAAKVSDYSLILKNTYEAGIMNNTFFLIGTPYDNLFETIKILAFLEEYGRYIYTIRPIIYKTSKWSPNAFNAELKGLTMNKNNPDLDIHLDMWKEKPKYGMSIHQARIFVKILELWVRYRHKVNPITRTYIYAQRLFVGPRLIKQFSKKAKPEEISGFVKKETLTQFTKTLKEELEKFAYISEEDFVQENIEKEYPNFESFDKENKTEIIKKFIHLYNSESKRRSFFDKVYMSLKSKGRLLTLNEIIDFSKKLQKIDNSIAY